MFGIKKKKPEQNPVQVSWNQKVQADLDLLLVPPGDAAIHLGQDLIGIKLSEQAGNKRYVKIAIDNFSKTTSVRLFQTFLRLPKLPGVLRPIRSAVVNLLAAPSCPIIACWIVLSGKFGNEALSTFKEIVEADGDPEIKKLFADLNGLVKGYRDIYALKVGDKSK